MKKHGLKAFITSFCLSLLIISFISNVLFSQKSENNNLEVVPSNNIALFLRHEAPQAFYSPASEIKKVSLSILNPTVPQDLDVKDIVISKVEVVEDDLAEVSANAALEQVLVPIDYEKPISKKEMILDNYADFIEKRAPVALEKPKVDVLAQKEVLYSPEIVVAQADVVEEKIEIPLLKGKEILFDGGVVVADSSSLAVKAADVEGLNFSSSELSEDLGNDEVEVVAEESPWVSMDKASPVIDAAWKEASGIKNPKNKMMEVPKVAVELVEEGLSETEVVAKNILIPIPSDVADGGVGVPEIVSFKEDSEVSDYKEEDERGSVESGSILKNIGSLFSKASDKVGAEIKEQVSNVSKKVSEAKNDGVRVLANVVKKSEVLPTEIRLAFAPNRVEISGKTLRWLNAFAQKSKEEAVALEIRLDGSSSYDLQQKRLMMIYNILAAKGVESGKVRTIFTDRDPNSFVVRVVKFGKVEKSVGDYKKYYQQR